MANVNPIPQGLTYTMNHPPLAALASQANDLPAVGVNVGDEILAEHLHDADNQVVLRQTLLSRGENLVTIPELITARLRQVSIYNDSVPRLPLGQDLVHEMHQMEDRMNERMIQMGDRMNERMIQMEERMNERMIQMEDRMNERMIQMEDRMNERMIQMNVLMLQMNDQLHVHTGILNAHTGTLNVHTGILVPLYMQSARNTNRTIQNHEKIAPVPNDAGLSPASLQNVNKADVLAFPVQVVMELLQFYGLNPAVNLPEAQMRATLFSHLGFL